MHRMGMRIKRGRAKQPALHIPQTCMGWPDMKRDMMIFCSLYHLRALSLKEEKEKCTDNSLQGHYIHIWFTCLTVLALMWNARKGCHQPDLLYRTKATYQSMQLLIVLSAHFYANLPIYLCDSSSILLISTVPFHRVVQCRSNAICTLKCNHHRFNTVWEIAKNPELFEHIQTLPSAMSGIVFNLEADKLAINRMLCIEGELSLLPHTQTPDNSTIWCAEKQNSILLLTETLSPDCFTKSTGTN